MATVTRIEALKAAKGMLKGGWNRTEVAVELDRLGYTTPTGLKVTAGHVGNLINNAKKSAKRKRAGATKVGTKTVRRSKVKALGNTGVVVSAVKSALEFDIDPVEKLALVGILVGLV